jgi:hypothetical protein
VKCIKCNIDNKLKDRKRYMGKCSNCRHEFAFDPKVMTGVDFTDGFFQQTLKTLSVNDSLFFSRKQLYYFLNQRLNKKKADGLKVLAGCSIPIVVFGGIVLSILSGISYLWFAPLLLIIPFAIAVLASESLRRFLRGGPRNQNLGISYTQLDDWYGRWVKLNGNSARLLGPVKERKTQTSIKPELLNYSFDRVVICDRAEVAHCLIANKFHFENNAAVLSLDGYPQDVFKTVMEMLRRNPDLSVYAVHDASSQGVQLPYILGNQAKWFGGTKVKIYDLGLLPRQIMNRSMFVEKQSENVSIPKEVVATLQPDELRWLNDGNFVALESIPPQILLRVITNGIAKSRDPQSSDSLAPVMMDGGVGDGFFYLYAWDSFG